MQLKDKVVITGSGSGIGEAFAYRFTTEGAKVVVTDITAEGVERVSQAVGTVGLATDIAREAGQRPAARSTARASSAIRSTTMATGLRAPVTAFSAAPPAAADGSPTANTP